MMASFNDETSEALKRLAENGSDLTRPMEVDFFVAAPSEDDGNKIALKARELGFTTSVEVDNETGHWTCYCTKLLVPEYFEIINIEQHLDAIAKELGGYIDGFGSYGNAEE